MKIFISSTQEDLKDHREAVRDAILRLGHQPIEMEDFGSRPAHWDTAALQAVEECDAFVGFYAHRYGSIPDGEIHSISEMEFDRAQSKGIPCFCYRVHPEHPWRPAWIDPPPSRDKLDTFLKKVDVLLRSKFTTPDDLAKQVNGDLGRHFQSPRITDAGFFEAQSPSSVPFDHKKCPTASKADLRVDKLRKFFSFDLVKQQDDYRPSAGFEDHLKDFGFLEQNRPAYGCLLCFGINPQRWVAGSSTKCVLWKGVSRDVGYLDSKEIRGNLLEQYDGALMFLTKNLRSQKDISTSGRSEKFEVPIVALEEAVANALVHREYERGNEKIQLEVFQDRIEVKSPGSLPEPMTLEMLGKEDATHPRNPMIARIFYLYGKVEQVGSGVQRIQNAMRLAGLQPAEFELSGAGIVKVIFRRPKLQDAQSNLNQVQYVQHNTHTDLVVGDKFLALPAALHQLRAPLADFTGRGDEIARLKQMLASGGTASVTGIRGMGGVGKTELAYKVADELRAQFPDAQLVLDLRGLDVPPRDPADALAEAVRAFVGMGQKLPETIDELASLYRSCLDGKRALILLDNAANDAQVRPFLPPPGSALLITSRQPLPFPTVSLDQLAPNEARALLQKIAPRVSDATADEICKLCGYLPLALRAAGNLLATTPDLKPATYAEQLRDESRRLEKLGTAGVPLGVEASFSLSYAQLDDESARVFRTLAVFPAPFDAGAEEVIAADAEHARLSELVRRGLALYDETEERYRLPDLIRLFADSKRDAPARDADALLHAQYYIQVASTADGLYKQGGENVLKSLALFDRELPQLRAAFEWLVEGTDAGSTDENARLLISLVDAVAYTSDLRFHPRERIRWLEAQLSAARQLNDKMTEWSALLNLGMAYADLGDARRAIEYYEQALTIVREIGVRRGEGNALTGLGMAYADLGDARRAIEYFEQALAIDREIGDRRGEGNALGNLGVAYKDLGDARRAIECYEQALSIRREIGDRRGEGAALGNLGNAYADLGDARRAIEYCEQALAIAREIGDRRGEAAALGNLGMAYYSLGDARRAIEYYEQTLAITREIGDRRGEGAVLGNLGIAYKNLGDARRAIEYYEQQLVITREIGDLSGEGSGCFNLSLAHEQLGNLTLALQYAERAVEIAQATESPRLQKRQEKIADLKRKIASASNNK